MKKITFFEVYLVQILCYYLNNYHLSVAFFIWEFYFWFKGKAPVEIASSAVPGLPVTTLASRSWSRWVSVAHKVRDCLASCTFLKEKATPSSSRVLCHSSISRSILRLESGHFGRWCPTETLQYSEVLSLGNAEGTCLLLVYSSIEKNGVKYTSRELNLRVIFMIL